MAKLPERMNARPGDHRVWRWLAVTLAAVLMLFGGAFQRGAQATNTNCRPNVSLIFVDNLNTAKNF